MKKDIKKRCKPRVLFFIGLGFVIHRFCGKQKNSNNIVGKVVDNLLLTIYYPQNLGVEVS